MSTTTDKVGVYTVGHNDYGYRANELTMSTEIADTKLICTVGIPRVFITSNKSVASAASTIIYPS